MANGMPSSLRQISTTASASPGWASEKSGTTLWARSTKRLTAADSVPALTSSEGTRHNCSSADPQSFAAGRENRYGRRGGQDGLDQIRGAVDERARSCRTPTAGPALQGGGHRLGHCLARLLGDTQHRRHSIGHRSRIGTAASSKNQTPSGNSSASRAATSSARRACSAEDRTALIGDENPCREPERWRRVLAKRLKIPYWTVDADVVVPSRVFDRSFFLLHHFRPHLKAALPKFLVAPPRSNRCTHGNRQRALANFRLSNDITAGFSKLDRSVKPVDTFTGGSHAALKRLSEFVRHDLAAYDAKRNHPESTAPAVCRPISTSATSAR